MNVRGPKKSVSGSKSNLLLARIAGRLFSPLSPDALPDALAETIRDLFDLPAVGAMCFESDGPTFRAVAKHGPAGRALARRMVRCLGRAASEIAPVSGRGEPLEVLLFSGRDGSGVILVFPPGFSATRYPFRTVAGWWMETLRRHRLAMFDPLTGLLNRRALEEAAARLVRLCERGRQPIAVLSVDLDGLKDRNDRFGHAAGDRALCTAAVALRDGARGSDAVGRVGGDEFLVWLPNTGRVGARAAARRLGTALAAPEAGGACIGIAAMDPAPRNWRELIGEADEALLTAKRAGPGRIAWREKGTEKWIMERAAGARSGFEIRHRRRDR